MMPPSKRLPWIITFSTYLYHRLLRFGPKEFLQEYEEVMLSDFRRYCHEAYKQQGIYSVLCLCPSMFINALIDMSAEQAVSQKKKIMPTSQGPRLHWLFYVGVGMMTMLILWMLLSTVSAWVMTLIEGIPTQLLGLLPIIVLSIMAITMFTITVVAATARRRLMREQHSHASSTKGGA